MIVTIDGPAASGKSTIAITLANKLGYYYLSTGLLYRAVAYIIDKKGMTLKDLSFIKHISYIYENNKPQILFMGENITQYLYDHKLSEAASMISSISGVRDALILLQREVAENNNVIAEGRDCGSIVFPDADYKFFLTARIKVRAKRAMSDSKRNGDENLDEVIEQIKLRDKRDSERDISPLIVPKDAIVIDNSDLNKEQTVNEFLKVVSDNK